MIRLSCGVLEGRADIGGLKIGKVPEDFLFAGASAEHVQDVLDADTHSANARAATALLGINGNPVQIVHSVSLSLLNEGIKHRLTSTATSALGPRAGQ
jgi:hypothetical protein